MTPPGAVAAALCAAFGVFLLFTSVAYSWRGLGFGPSPQARREAVPAWLARTGIDRARAGEVIAASAVCAATGAAIGFAVFGGTVAPVVSSAVAGSVPVAAARNRQRRRRDDAREAWPRIIEHMRLSATSLGRSLPQALFDAAALAPVELQPAFAAAQREWLLSTDFERTLNVLRHRCADATADAVCETLLVAHEVGGSGVDQRLAALAQDRIADLRGRKDAASRQAGARFARRFVLLVPATMAIVGLSIGDGRAAYAAPQGQVAVMVAMAMLLACWVWAGRLLRLPEARRQFASDDRDLASAARREAP